MCGLAGLFLAEGARAGAREEELVRRMSTAQAHRGPDDSGVQSVGRACLGSLRLSIIDLSPAGHMPMSDESGRFTLAYNGEIYNFAELRAELEGLGHAFRSRTDTEVLLRAWMEWGAAALERFVGMFAFALYDRDEDALTLVRDRFGIKPLYWLRVAGGFAFASELKAFFELGETLRPEERTLAEWALYQNVDGLSHDTLIEGARTVLPGERVTLRGGEPELERWYSPPRRVQRARFERAVAAGEESVRQGIEDLVHRAVVDRLVSDVPVGTLLSGGLDSSLVTAVAARHREGIVAFHVSIAEAGELDERRFAEEAARAVGVELVPFELTGAIFRRELARVIRQSDVPLTHPNSVAYALISEVAKRHGVTVLLSGEGADELFGGYAFRYRRYRSVLRFRRWLERMPAKLRKGLEVAGYAGAGLPVTAHRFEQLLPGAVDFLDRYARRGWTLECEEAYAFAADPTERALLGAMLADLVDFLSPLLRRLDRTSMGASVECRVPFLDHRLAEEAMHLPLAYRVGKRADKWILKRIAADYLPRALVERKKMGFPLPLADWLAPLASAELFADGFCRGELGLDARGLERFLADRREHRARPYALLGLVTLEIWGRLYFLGEPLASVEERIARLEPPARGAG